MLYGELNAIGYFEMTSCLSGNDINASNKAVYFKTLQYVFSKFDCVFFFCRIFPVLPGNGRVTQDDLIVGGYFIPKGVRTDILCDTQMNS